MLDPHQEGYNRIIIVSIEGYPQQVCSEIQEAYDELGIDDPASLVWSKERNHWNLTFHGIGAIDVIFY